MSKHLTDAECAAEYWRAEYEFTRTDAGLPPSDFIERDFYGEVSAWDRFATHPHAT